MQEVIGRCIFGGQVGYPKTRPHESRKIAVGFMSLGSTFLRKGNTRNVESRGIIFKFKGQGETGGYLSDATRGNCRGNSDQGGGEKTSEERGLDPFSAVDKEAESTKGRRKVRKS